MRTDPATSRRLFLEDKEGDDAERNRRLREILSVQGDPCGGIEAALMLSVGTWAVSCARGHVHRVVFGPDGTLVEAKRVL